ncbi:MAG: ABC transporter ATP-binding protein [Myxococcota bacterium]|nr:ABC transporter ATP-binding protein [Myxococcota bacterium]
MAPDARREASDPLARERTSERPAGAEAAVRLRRLTKRFGAKTAVDGVSLVIEQGAVFGLIGPNGAGKTTMFSMMAGYLRPTEGSIEMLGFAPTAVDELRSRVGVLPQDAMLPAGDRVGELLVHLARLQDLPPSKAAAAAQRSLDDVDGAAWWRQRCGSLSHGMAKRVALAQAFLGEPDLVLLDEPTAGLDPRVAFEMRQLIKAKRGRATIVISSHNLQELEEICDAAVVLDRGRVVASGTMSELTAANEEIRIKVAPGTRRGGGPGAVPVQELRELGSVKAVDFDDGGLEIAVFFERGRADAETVIGQVLTILLRQDVRISGVTKGRGLEQRVMALT